MKSVTIQTRPGFDEWRTSARDLLQAGYRPEDIFWQNEEYPPQDLFGPEDTHILSPSKKITVTKGFLELAQFAACHASPDRFALLYRILWRMTHENKNLLHYKTDNDILKLNAYVKAVRHDAYKIKAFLRFRETNHAGQNHFIAWYEPEHYSLELSLPFFQTRFKNMVWSILTPYLAAHWDRENLALQENPDPSCVPKEDAIEQYWLKYYASIFNPARPKKGAMLSQMPKKYWKNMPETALIQDLLRQSETRTRKMIELNCANEK
jgi:uracil-DNA glycosylase